MRRMQGGLIFGTIVCLLAVQSAWAGPLDRIRATNCGPSGCQGTTMQEAEQKKNALRKEAQEKRLAELYGTPKPPQAAPPRSTILKFDKTDPLYQLLMQTLIDESKARKKGLTQKPGESTPRN